MTSQQQLTIDLGFVQRVNPRRNDYERTGRQHRQASQLLLTLRAFQ